MDLITKHLCLSKEVGINENMFGGVMMSYLDLAGAIYCAELCETNTLVTKKFEVNFENPVKVGNIIHIYGSVVSIGRTSISIKLEARKVDVESGEQKTVCSVPITYVRIDSDGHSKPHNKYIKDKINKLIESYKCISVE
jgi:acyl-CoA thioesterase YciA